MKRTLASVVAALTLVASGWLVAAPPAAAVANGLARTPQMGFNNWNATGCGPDFNETTIRATADLFVSTGLRQAGYQYVNIDDCWALPDRDSAGNLVPDPARFPHGIKALADYVHGKGLKFGIYSSAGTRTCSSAGFPGALGHERQDAALWASWGVDYLKYDNCNNDANIPAVQRYTAMRDALNATGRPILLAVCEWGENQPWNWAADVGNSWRTTQDVADNYASMVFNFNGTVGLDAFAGPGHWNDPDMLEVGNGGMTDAEYRSQFSLWSIMAAPLLIGTDLRKASPATMQILTNSDVIAVDQDPLGAPGRQISSADGHHVIVKPLADGTTAIALFNETNTTATIDTSLSAMGLVGSYTLHDLWAKTSGTTDDPISVSVPAHTTVLYRAVPHRRTGIVHSSGALDVKDSGGLYQEWTQGVADGVNRTGGLQFALDRTGVLRGTDLWVKDGLRSDWGGVVAQDTRAFQLEGDRIGALNGNGDLVVKEGPVNAPWAAEDDNVRKFQLDGTQIAVLHKDGTLWLKQGGLSASWIQLADSVDDFGIAGDWYAVHRTDGTFQVKAGRDAPWYDQGVAVKAFQVTPSGFGVLLTDGRVAVKYDNPQARWYVLTDTTRQAKSFQMAGNRIGVLFADGLLSVKEGPEGAFHDERDGVTAFQLVGDRIGVLTGGNLVIKEGGLDAFWAPDQTTSGDVVDFRLLQY